MRITSIVPEGRKGFLVSVDGECAFVLYQKELAGYRIREGGELSEETFSEITRKVLPRRAKLRCMHLLKSRSYTRKQLEDKLRLGKYPENAIEEAIAYVQSFGYVDDAAYAESYSDHPISRSILEAYDKRVDTARIGTVEELAGRGVRAVIDGRTVCVGNSKLMDELGVKWHPCHHVGTTVHV